MRILILSNYPWKNSNSFGNTYSSIFGKVPNTEIAHVYMFEGKPDPIANVSNFYQILERDVMKSVFCLNKGIGVGERIYVHKEVDNEIRENEHRPQTLYGKLLSFGKRNHWILLFWARELAWKFGRINYDGLMDFVRVFKPDIFFLPYSNTFYTNRLALYIKNHYDIPMVIEMAMDHYSLHRVSWSPLFWMDRFAKRRQIKKLVNHSEMMFVISKKLKEELETELKLPCRVLYKTPDKLRAYKAYERKDGTVRFLFTGNISANRWKSLALLVNELKVQQFGHLDIYTPTPISCSMSRALNVEGVSSLHPPVSQSEVIDLQNNADILVHAEAFDKYNKSLVRCAISTKIMDYLSVGRCILAIGPSDVSSIEYLTENDVALIADSKEMLSQQVSAVRTDRQLIGEYAEKGRNYAVNQLNEDVIRKEFYDELQSVIDHYYKE